MKNKQLIRRQINYLNILSEFNFQIIFRSSRSNSKVDALSRISVSEFSELIKFIEDRYQTFLTSNRVNILIIKSMIEIYERVFVLNKTNELCNKYKKVIADDDDKLHSVRLKDCRVINDILFKRNLL